MPFLGLAAAIVVAIALGLLGIRHESKPPGGARQRPPVIDLQSAHWVAPTDFLLYVPGDWLLRDLPRITAPDSSEFSPVIYRRIST